MMALALTVPAPPRFGPPNQSVGADSAEKSLTTVSPQHRGSSGEHWAEAGVALTATNTEQTMTIVKMIVNPRKFFFILSSEKLPTFFSRHKLTSQTCDWLT
ncbi:hypothetical protein KBC89_01075 [Candidatus Woesebacteria bacterium]|nr:hypothetical protein [Candidatus Woesebacteria bacterium]